MCKQSMYSNLEGREFDWFALDSEGNIAMFATAGEGFIPESVVEHYAQHDSVSESIFARNTGTAKVWSDYAACGLYVFDWNLYRSSYLRQASPTRAMSKELKSRIQAITKLQHFSGLFSTQHVFESW